MHEEFLYLYKIFKLAFYSWYQSSEWSRGDLSDIGALIESPHLYENLTAKENLKVGTLLLGLPDSRIHEVLETVSLTDTGKKRAWQYLLYQLRLEVFPGFWRQI